MKITKRFKKQILSFLIVSAIFSFQFWMFKTPASADAGFWDSQAGMNEVGGSFGAKDKNSVVDIRITVIKTVNTALVFLGIIFVLLLIVAGFQYMTAGGNEDQVKKSMGRIKTAVIGVLIIFMSWSISMYILTRLNSIISGRTNYLYEN